MDSSASVFLLFIMFSINFASSYFHTLVKVPTYLHFGQNVNLAVKGRVIRTIAMNKNVEKEVASLKMLTRITEMSDFFGEQFEIIILEIQAKYIDDKNVIETEIDSQKQRIELLERNNLDQEQKDMWDD